MDSISAVDALSTASKARDLFPAARMVSSYGDEIAQLIAASLANPASPTLGTQIDVKA